MANWQGYILISELPPGWTNEQRLAIKGGMGALGKQSDAQPAKNNHSRVSQDGLSMLFEAEFDEAEIIEAAIITMLAGVLGLPEAAVSAKINYTIFGEGESLGVSRGAARALLIANAADWEPTE